MRFIIGSFFTKSYVDSAWYATKADPWGVLLQRNYSECIETMGLILSLQLENNSRASPYTVAMPLGETLCVHRMDESIADWDDSQPLESKRYMPYLSVKVSFS